MSSTTGTGAKKILNTDDWRDIFDIHNDTVDAYDGKIGTTVLPTTAQTLTGAISEHNAAITNISVNTQHMTDGTIISDLDNIPVGTQGRVKLASALRPNSGASLYDYNCHGEGTTRTLIVSSEYYKRIWVNYKNGSTWSGWQELAKKEWIIPATWIEAVTNASMIIVTAIGTINGNDIALSIMIDPALLTSTKRFWQVGDAYNSGATMTHFQIYASTTEFAPNLYYGSAIVQGAQYIVRYN